MTVEQPLDSKEVQEFQFKLVRRLNVFSGAEFDYSGHLNVVAVASKHGLAFVGCPSGVQAIIISTIVNNEAHGNKILNEYPHRILKLNNQPTHLNLSCDQFCIAVGLKKDGCAHALIYSVQSFLSKSITLLNEVRLSASPNTHILDLTWNPGTPNILASCLSDGTLVVYEFKPTGTDIKMLPAESQASCFSWSPRGKQLVVGTYNGELVQYKPDLKAVKTLPAPALSENPVAVLNVLWLSNYQFAAVYRDKVNESERPVLIIVNAPKTGGVSFVNFDDICYSSGDLRRPQFYLFHQQTWNVMLVASANSMEVGVVGLTEDQVSWQQWIQEDACRAELPMSSDKQETFPIGLGWDTSTANELPWGDNQVIPPMPVLHLLSHKGVLCLFYVINVIPGAAAICSKPEKIPDDSSLALFSSKPVQPSPSATEGHPSGSRVNLAPKFESMGPQKSPVTPQGSTPQVSTPQASTPQVSTLQAFTLQASTPLASTPQKDTINISLHSSISEPGISILNSGFSSPFMGVKTSVENVPEKAKSAPNFGGVQGVTAMGSLNFSPAKTTSVGLTQAVTLATSQSNLTFATPTTVAPNTKIERTAIKTDNIGQPSVDSESTSTPNNEITIGVINAAIKEEIQLFERELQDLRKRVASVNTYVGTQEEKELLQKKVEQMEEFSRELEDTTRAQTTEVQGLKSLMMETFVWVEDAKSRQRKITKPSELEELPLMPDLDPVILHYWTSIQQSMFYVESQLKQLNKILDFDWLQFQNACRKNSANTLQVPTLEAIYKVLNLENRILLKKKADVEKIIKQVDQYRQRQGKRTSLLSSLNPSKLRGNDNGEIDISRLAEKLLNTKLLDTDGAGSEKIKKIISLNRLATLSAREKKLSGKKQSTLQDLFTQHFASHITPIKVTRDKFTSSSSLLYLGSPASSLKPGGVSSGRAIAQSIIPTMSQNALQGMKNVNQKSGKLVSKSDPSITGQLTVIQGNSVQQIYPKALNNVVVSSASGKPIIVTSMATNLSSGTLNLFSFRSTSSTSSNQPTMGTFSLNTGFSKGTSPALNFGQSSQTSVFGSELAKKDSISSHHGQTQPLTLSFGSGSKSPAGVQPLNNLNTSVSRTGAAVPSVFASFSLNTSGKSSETTAVSISQSATTLSNKGQAESGINTVSQSEAVESSKSVPAGHDSRSHLSISNTTVTSAQSPVSMFGTTFSKTSSSLISSSASSEPVHILFTNSQAPTSFSVTGNKNLAASQNVPFSSTPSLEVSANVSSPVPNVVISTNQGKAPAAAPVFSFSLSNTDKETGVINASTGTPGFGSLQPKGEQTFNFAQLGATVSLSTAGDAKKESAVFSVTPGSISTTLTTSFAVSQKVETVKSDVTISKIPSQISTGTSDVTAPSVTAAESQLFSFSFGDKKTVSSTPNQTAIATTASLFFGQPICGISSPGQGGTNIFSQAAGSKMLFGNLSTTTSNLFGMTAANTSVTKSVFGPQATTAPSQSSPLSLPQPAAAGASAAATVKETSASPTSQVTTVTTTAAAGVSTAAAKSNPLFTAVSPSVSSSSQSVFGASSSAVVSSAVPSLGSLQLQSSVNNSLSTAAVTVQQPSNNSVLTTSVPVSTDSAQSTFSSPSLFSVPTPVSSIEEPSVNTAPTTAAPLFGNATVTFTVLTTTPSTTTATTSTFLGSAASSSTASPVADADKTTPTTDAATPSPSPPAAAAATSTSLPVTVSAATPVTIAAAVSSSSVSVTVTTATATVVASPVTASTTTITFATSAAPPIFGGTSTTTASTLPSVFGSISISTTAAATPLFGTAVSSPTSAPSPFGSAVTSSSGFGVAPTTSAPSLFGAALQTSSAPSIFGQTQVSQATAASPFGGSTGASSTSLFGGNTEKTSLFGGATTQANTSLFGGKPVFGQTPVATSSSTFGQSNPVFGQAATTTFGGGASGDGFGNKSVFGQTGGSVFGQPPRFGFGGTSFGGGTSLFGGSSPTGNAFKPGGTTGSLFGGSSTPTTHSGGAFSAGAGQGVGQTGFGSSPSFQNKQAGFGSPPVFGAASPGGSPGFGAPPTFGGAPTFGGSPTFGSPSSIFGSTATGSPGFGVASTGQQHSTTFESLASQNTLTFGNLASQSGGFGAQQTSLFGGTQAAAPSSAPAFSSSSTTFGGSSFSSWR